METKKQKLLFVFLLVSYFFLPSYSFAAADPTVIKAKVEQTVEARKAGHEAELLEGPVFEPSQPSSSVQKETVPPNMVLYRFFNDKIVIRRVAGQWYLSF